MANCSDAYGDITLLGLWTPAMLHNLNILKQVWASWTYCIDISEDFTPSLRSQGFCGIGRWSFQSNLESLDEWMRNEFDDNPNLAAALMALTADMEQHDSRIEFTYADEEAGCLSMGTGAVTFAAKDGALIIVRSDDNSLDYSWENYLGLNFGGEEQLEELVLDLLKMFTLGTSDETLHGVLHDRVEAWAMSNTLPHDSVDGMREELTTKLRSDFSDVDMPNESKEKYAAITSGSENIRIESHFGTWHVISARDTERHGTLFLLEHDIYGDETACLIVNGIGEVIVCNVWNGFLDYEEWLAGEDDCADGG